MHSIFAARRLVLRLLLVGSGTLAVSGCQTGESRGASEAETILANATRSLWERQAGDGGWHSELHGVMKTGQTLTPYVLYSLMEVPDSIYVKGSKDVERALNFIRRHVNGQGVLGLADPDIIEYPTYSTSYALRVLSKYGSEKDTIMTGRMISYLMREQLTEQRGIHQDHPAYGSWGFGETNLSNGRVGHVDLSHTRHVLEALREAGVRDTVSMRKATRFLRLLQKHPSHEHSAKGTYDGGFYFSPVVLDQNKAGRDEESFRSYATATCGGVMALLATGHSAGDEPVRAARAWLEANSELSYPAGIPEDDPEQWRKVLFFYHLSVRAEVYEALKKEGDWGKEIIELLSERQKEDGSFANPFGSPNKEDDPILATALVVRTLTHVIGANSRR